MSLVPPSFLLRVSYPCRYFKQMPHEDEDRLLDLPVEHRLENFAAMDGRPSFADVRLAWNELGIGFQVEVKGKEQQPQGDVSRILRFRRRHVVAGHAGRPRQPPR